MKKLSVFLIAVSFVAVLALKFASTVRAQRSINLSGYEFLLGTSCSINGQAGKCGVEFGGWTGGSGPGPNGWTPFPGNKQGLWDAEINYTGSPDFGATVNLQSGSFDVLFKTGRTISGTITGGTVMWPAITDGTVGDLGCGTGVAIVSVNLNTGGSFNGCLHDLPAGTVIPPTIWGKLQ
jgi:hypothetical protein